MDIKEIIARAFAHWTNEFWWKALVALNGLKRTKITPEEKQEAMQEYLRLKQEKIHSLDWLVFVGMGMENDDLWNYRFRTYIRNKEWKNYFIEIQNHKGVNIDCIVDIDLREHHEKMLNELYKDKKRYNDMSGTEKKLVDLYMKQPYYTNTREINEQIKDKKMTLHDVMELVNRLFNTNFKTVEIENNLLSCDDYISIDR